MHNVRTMIAGRSAGAGLLLRAAFAGACAALVCGCQTDQQVAGAPAAPADYRLRHPITISEKDQTLQLFIGANRGSLLPEQRAELLAFAQSWRDHATGGVIVDLPVGSINAHSSADALREIVSILAATGVPTQSVGVRKYRASPGTLATVRVSYPKITADAGPCGVWPEDMGPSFNRDYFENQPPWNYGCATQRNLAAMVVDPADLVQPRAETPAYTMRRDTVIEKYRLGLPTSTPAQNVTPTAGQLSDVGQ